MVMNMIHYHLIRKVNKNYEFKRKLIQAFWAGV